MLMVIPMMTITMMTVMMMVGDTRVGLVESALLISIWVAIGIRMLPPAYKLYIYVCIRMHTDTPTLHQMKHAQSTTSSANLSKDVRLRMLRDL